MPASTTTRFSLGAISENFPVLTRDKAGYLSIWFSLKFNGELLNEIGCRHLSVNGLIYLDVQLIENVGVSIRFHLPETLRQKAAADYRGVTVSHSNTPRKKGIS